MFDDFNPDTDSGIDIKITTHSVHQYDVYLTGVIGDPREYVEFIHLIRTATDKDLINIYINSQGGQLRTGASILHAIAGSHAYIRTILDGDAYSMASIIALAGNEVIPMQSCQWMAHNYSSMYYGKGNESESRLLSDKVQFRDMCTTYYKGFLTKAEIVKVLNGTDIYLTYQDITKRLQKLGKGN